VKGAITSRIAHAAIFQENILEAFLEQVRVDQPIQYIYAGLAQSRLWLPIFYFARLSGNSNDAVANLVSSLKISQKGKQYQLVERLAFRRKALAKYVTRAAAEMAAEIMSGTVRSPDSVLEAGVFCQALTGIKETAAPLIQLLEALRRCRQLAEAADDSNAVGSVFKAACRVDEMFFSRDGRGEENSCVG
jgi:hypothetical protein